MSVPIGTAVDAPADVSIMSIVKKMTNAMNGKAVPVRNVERFHFLPLNSLYSRAEW